MSTLKVTNIQATGETASRAVSGVAAAWVNFNGTGTIAARDSFNVASLTDNATGDYSINYSSSMGNNDYSPSSIARGNDQVIGTGVLSTSSGRFYGVDLDGGRGIADTDTVSIQIFGDLA